MRSAQLRRLLVGLGLFVTAAVGVTACGDKYGEAGAHDPARAAERARQVSDAWEGSEAARLWREGYFPLGDPVRLPEGAFHSDADKQAYQRQNFELRGSLPGAPPKKGEVRWRGGGSLAVPVVSARAAYEKVGGGSVPGPRLTVTGARLGKMTIHTSRGLATVPAWHFTIKGYDTPLKRVAVVASKLPKPPVKPAPDLTEDLWKLAGLNTVSRDGRTVVLRAHHGSCDDGPGVDVLESADNVVFSAWIRNPSDGPCTKELRAKNVTVKLDRPVGDRMLLDAFTGRPVPYEGSPGSRSSSWS
ncbi:hypothetical protein OOK29_25590 [Streptomyces phaeochromogenes]|uniref:hypothetical protein n=1 Tax=Streptomyces phaeochromogenes TaxID=1923 RepID=UPI002258F01E|nr:hypothetical protein [Streptomyces phaeochromogenes]MCX5601526.1 hypothetical protein [Streptomyces phaeochromogenes]